MDLEDEKKSIRDKLKSEDVVNFLNKYDISSMLTFGSLNNEDFSEDSDIDIAIIGKHKIYLDEILEIELFLAKLLNKEIDVIDLKSENLYIFLKINVLNEGEVIYSNDDNYNLEVFKNETDKIYKENENFLWFRKKDVLS